MRLGRTCKVVVQGRRDVKYGTAGKTEGSTASNIVAHHFPKKLQHGTSKGEKNREERCGTCQQNSTRYETKESKKTRDGV